MFRGRRRGGVPSLLGVCLLPGGRAAPRQVSAPHARAGPGRPLAVAERAGLGRPARSPRRSAVGLGRCGMRRLSTAGPGTQEALPGGPAFPARAQNMPLRVHRSLLLVAPRPRTQRLLSCPASSSARSTPLRGARQPRQLRGSVLVPTPRRSARQGQGRESLNRKRRCSGALLPTRVSAAAPARARRCRHPRSRTPAPARPPPGIPPASAEQEHSCVLRDPRP